MNCKKCRSPLPEGANYCPHCGAKSAPARGTRTRGNGQGTVFRRGNTWTAQRVVGRRLDDQGHARKITRSKGGFKTKREAINALPFLTLETAPERRRRPKTLRDIYEAWEPTHRAGASTMGCYRAASNWLEPVMGMPMEEITIDDLQECMDDCPNGKRTKQNIKALVGLLYKYAIPRKLADINLGTYLHVSGDAGDKTPLPEGTVEKLEAAVGTIPGAEVVLCQCFLGFRPSELLDLDCTDYDRAERAFVGGAKTDAGRDRTVTVSPKIQPIIDRLTADRIGGPVFRDNNGRRLTLKAYRAQFYKVLDALEVENPKVTVGAVTRYTYTPHSCRHVFATLVKRVEAPDKDKLELIGHTDVKMLQHYQGVSLEDLRRITDAM